jgi:L-ascorbate metabolism protein UlaG (beta-lactamase superfamily)
MESLTSNAERLLGALLWPCSEPVERHGNSESQLGHDRTPKIWQLTKAAVRLIYPTRNADGLRRVSPSNLSLESIPLNHSGHFDGRRFFNPDGANGQPFWRVPQLLLTPRTRWPSAIPVEHRRPPAPAGDEVIATFIGHSTLLIQSSSGNVLVDPVYSQRASPVSFAGPRRVREPGVRFHDLPAIALVLLSHNHYDHCDLATLKALTRRFHPPAVTLLGNGRLLRSAGFRQIEEIDWWESATAAPLAITVTPAQHFSARGPFDRNRALWGGFLIEVGGLRILHAGDSGYGPHFREIAGRLGPIDLAFLPIGAYEPRWFMKDIHMNPAEAVQAHLDLAARQSVGVHFGTFQLTPEGVDQPVHDLAEALQQRGVQPAEFRTLEVGNSVYVRPLSPGGHLVRRDSPH